MIIAVWIAFLIVADILAGIFMTFEGVVHAGDMVMFNGKRGVVHSIGVRTTTLRWFNEDTIVRNNDFKNFINLPSLESERITTTIRIDLSESLDHVESILEKELPAIQERLCEITDSYVDGPTYLGVEELQENYIVLSFAILCEGRYLGMTLRQLNRELKKMCERNDIKLAMTQVVLHTDTE